MKHKKTNPDIIMWLARPKVAIVLILLSTLLLYANTLNHGFTQDDAIVIYQNKLTQEGFSGIPDIFSHDSFYGFFMDESKAQLVSGGRYRPLTIVFFATLYEFVGSSEFAFHLFNVLSYAFLCLLIFKLTFLVAKNLKEKERVLFALLVAIIFCIHPVHTEVVANIKGLDEIWSLAGSLSGTYFIIKYIDSKKTWLLLIAGLSFFAALLSKESAIVFALLIPIIVYFTRSKISNLDYVIILGTLFVPVLFYMMLRNTAIPFNLGTESFELMNNPFLKIEGGKYIAFSPEEKWASIILGFGKYLQLMIFPHPLVHDYYPRSFDIIQISDAKVILSIIMNSCLIVIMLLGIRKKSIISLSILLFYGTIGLTSNILFPIGTHISERFLFAPSLSISILTGMFIFWLISIRLQRKIAIFVFLVLFFLSSFKTISRNIVWKDDFTLFQTDVLVNSKSAKLQNAAGGSLIDMANTKDGQERIEMLQTAVKHLNTATAIHPNYKNAHLLLGNAHLYLKEFDLAILAYKNALRIDPNYLDVKNNLLLSLVEAARASGSIDHDFNKSRTYLFEALRVDPDYDEAINLLGVSYGSEGNHELALEQFQKAIFLKPNNAHYRLNLSLAHSGLGNVEEAKKNLLKAKELDPNILTGKQ